MQENTMQHMWQTTHISGGNATYVEELYEIFLKDPNSIPEQWKKYFLDLLRGKSGEISRAAVGDYFRRIGSSKKHTHPAQNLASPELSKGVGYSADQIKQLNVLKMIDAFRAIGHQRAAIDPLGLMVRKPVAELELAFYGLSDSDLDSLFNVEASDHGDKVTLRHIIEKLSSVYCATIGSEFMHIVDSGQRQWFKNKLETVDYRNLLSVEEKKKQLKLLAAAEGLEKYLGSKYPGTKRFGLEGGESLIPLMHEIINQCGEHAVREVIIGMAHRGRLNVLVNVLGKNPSELFDEFEGKKLIKEGSGDVKYHLGFSSNVMTKKGKVHLALAFNPSHLEIVAPVVEGSVRARQDRYSRTEASCDKGKQKVISVVIHGDSAFAGQGVVMETFQLSQTRAYGTGGTIHIVVNNQVGFTTSRQDDSRSTEYCTDVAKTVGAPILHVNADDIDAVIFVTRLAVDYRMRFNRDIVIDLVCYRRRGHNEADEPSGTQPLMYEKIKTLKTTVALYSEQLCKQNTITEDAVKKMSMDYRTILDEGRSVVSIVDNEERKSTDWAPFFGQHWTADYDSKVDVVLLQTLGHQLAKVPEGFALQRQVAKIVDDRIKMAGGGLSLNWGMAELLAYATLLHDGYPVRLTGQDVGRGTFSHRHAVLHNQKDDSVYIPLAHLMPDQPRIQIYDSILSEEAVLAFEYGYAASEPNNLIIWEAQFGDFANGAQVVIDQFITSGEHKWGRLSGLVMLLPHGYEGQGPEHSSARMERFLQLAAEHNIQVCVPTTPAQIFHLLRRQAIRPVRKPLVVLTPKSLLRHKLAISTLEDLAEGAFNNVISDQGIPAEKVTRLLLCSGKLYYDLIERRQAENIEHIAVVRIEQLYPFPEEEMAVVMGTYPNLTSVVWCQEEPKNQGAWYCSQHNLHHAVNNHNNDYLYLSYVGRDASAAPASGYTSVHMEQQERLIAEALQIQK